MSTPLEKKSSVSTIQKRFDNDVERFSNLDTGQASTIDAALMMDLITGAATSVTAEISRVLDIGCGAGNNSIKLSQKAGPFDCDLVDLSLPMLEKAKERLHSHNSGKVRIFQGDIRKIDLPAGHYDVIIAAAVMHHLRDDEDWLKTMSKIYHLTAPGGSFWITDLVAHDNEDIDNLMWQRYGDYLVSSGGEEYKDTVFEYIDLEDSPRSVLYQLDLLNKVGFTQVELLHKNSCFAAFGAVK